MSRRQNIQDFFEKISLAQRISAGDRAFKDYSGADTEIALSLAFFNTMLKFKIIDEEDETVKILMYLLKEQSKAVLASSPNTDIFTKLGFRFPKSERVLDFGKESDKGLVEPPV